MLVTRIHCSNSLPTPFGVSQFYFLNPKGREHSQETGMLFSLFHSSLMPWVFFSMDIHCSQALFLCVYMHYNKCDALLSHSFTFLLPPNPLRSISVITFHTIVINKNSHPQSPVKYIFLCAISIIRRKIMVPRITTLYLLELGRWFSGQGTSAPI